ncbi:hypothetical protein KVR01_003209 [Diaporthe batatas]|uniref:uncharacterized protein n=1 Tax=Diaporthe batatas TaxID=748121 RepID=UPI001D04FF34|nr:uncharacterized protein KVR01_003209 [Diaporthe batatas]KAG8167520.1 hypothetical protein KVR01_003209 [Diaporthe batatas]
MEFSGHMSDHADMEAFQPNAGPSRRSKSGKSHERGASKRKKRHKKDGARAKKSTHNGDQDHREPEDQPAEVGRHSYGQSQEMGEIPNGQGERISMERDRDTDSDGGAALNSRPDSPGGHQPFENHDDPAQGGTAVHADASEELDRRDTSDSEELLPAHHQPPPSHQVSPEESEYSSDEARNSDSQGSQSMHEPMLTDDDPAQRTRPRKRKSPEDAHSSTGFRPLKRAKTSFNRTYLDLLNEDIEHAVAQYVPHGRETKDLRISMPSSQIGTVTWTPMEKDRFFEALGRLGRDDSPGIARRIRTKSDLEVRQYLRLLQDGLEQRRRQNELDPLELADFPAAVEISHECCGALDEEADSLALRLENVEQTNEQHKHGEEWLITQEKCKDAIQDEAVDGPLAPESWLNTQNWLKMSERLFMNGASEDSNWQSVDGDFPSLRHSTLEDFYSVALTLTRRLVSAALYITNTRIRSERDYHPEVLAEVRQKDVRAAALSLGLMTEKNAVLARAARRLGLHIYEQPPKPSEEEDEATMMPYDAVEHALGLDVRRNISSIRHKIQRIGLSSDEEHVPQQPAPEHSDMALDTDPVGSDENYPSDGDDEEEQGEEVRAEADEVMLYSAVDQPQTKRDRETLFRRIKAEREQEAYADAVDAQATYQEERRMWEEVLGRSPRQPLVDPGLPPGGRRMKVSVGAGYSVGKDWRAHTKVASEWESRSRLHG